MSTPAPQLAINATEQPKLRLKCDVDSNPPATVTWFKNDKRLLQVGNELNLDVAEYSSSHSANGLSRTYGVITCKALTPGFKEISHSTILLLNGLPAISGENVYLAEKDKNFIAKFSVLSSPPSNVSCKFWL